jgi:hypothetical protein
MAQVVPRPDSNYPIIIKPYKLDISQFGDKVRDEMKFNITNVSDQDLQITLIDRPEGIFDITIPSEVEAGKSAQGVLKLHSDAVDESFDKSVTIQLNDADSSRFTIPIKRTVRQPGETASAKGTPGQ